MTHVMLDFETMGLRPSSVLLSIGAVVFSPTGPSVLDNRVPFYMNISTASCLAVGMTQDESTVAWWQTPDKADAWQQLQHDQKDVAHVFQQFISWFKDSGGTHIWSQGSCFDVVLAEDAMRRLGMTPPWKFWDIRDTRTVYDVFGFNPRWVKREGTFHNALDDCYHQIKCVQQSYARGNRIP